MTDFELKNLNKKLLQIKQNMCLLKMTLVFLSVSYFNNDGAQHYLILPPLYYTLNRLGDTEKTVSWRSKGLSAEKLTTPTTTSNSLSQSIK